MTWFFPAYPKDVFFLPEYSGDVRIWLHTDHSGRMFPGTQYARLSCRFKFWYCFFTSKFSWIITLDICSIYSLNFLLQKFLLWVCGLSAVVLSFFCRWSLPSVPFVWFSHTFTVSSNVFCVPTSFCFLWMGSFPFLLFRVLQAHSSHPFNAFPSLAFPEFSYFHLDLPSQSAF